MHPPGNSRSVLGKFTTAISFALLFFEIAVAGMAQSPSQKSLEGRRPWVVYRLEQLNEELTATWPRNRTIRLVFHGHSVPAGYFATPTVRTFDAYPSLTHRGLCERFPTAVIDVSVTAIGGENSESGAERFERDVLSLRPDVIFIDYAMNDRGIGPVRAERAWRSMILAAAEQRVPVVLLTSTPTSREDIADPLVPLARHADQIRGLAEEFGLPLIDSYDRFRELIAGEASVDDFLSQPVHPNRRGHQVVADLILARLWSDADSSASLDN